MGHPASILVRRLVRGFDAVCAVLGLALLVALTPGLLVLSAHASGPRAGELVRIEGTLTSCHSDRDGSVFTLSGQPGSYRSVVGPPETCADSLLSSAKDLRVAVYVNSADRQLPPGAVAIPTYGMAVAGTVLRSANQDMRIGRIDAAVFLLLAIGSAATLFMLVRSMRRARKPFGYLLTVGLAP
jgi:hypothetical protein